jgi:hypothetical protein
MFGEEEVRGVLSPCSWHAPNFGVAGEEGATHEQEGAPLSHDANGQWFFDVMCTSEGGGL